MELTHIDHITVSSQEVLYRRAIDGTAHFKHNVLNDIKVEFHSIIEKTAIGDNIELEIKNKVDYPLMLIRKEIIKWIKENVRL